MNIEQIQQQRYEILAELYGNRLSETGHQKNYLSKKHLTNLVGDCTFNLNLLQEQGYIEGKAGNNRITAKGIHSYEDN